MKRVFATKLRTLGFIEVRRGEDLPLGIEDCARYPLFTTELLALMRRHLPSHHKEALCR